MTNRKKIAKRILTDPGKVRDLLKYPELRFLDRFHILPPLTLAVGLYALGVWLARVRPELNTGGGQLLVWGFFVSTVALYHITFCINSIAHMFGSRRFATGDESRNHLLLALLTMGEGWHNNHHHYPVSARQGFYWWELDLTYYILLLLQKLRIVWDVRVPPVSVYAEANGVGAVAGGRP